MPQTIHSRVLILGGGPAGYTAAIYAARASLSPVLVQGLQPGGQLTVTTDVENYPGFAEAVQGPWLVEQMAAQAQHVGTRLVDDVITALDLSARPFHATGDGGDTYTADTLVLATGAQARWLGLPSERHFSGAGVSACATCDGFFFRGKAVAVIGGGNTAVEEALYLTNHASSVTVIHRRDSFRAERILQDRLFAQSEDPRGLEQRGGEHPGHCRSRRSVTGVRLRDRAGAVQDIAVDGVFIAIGHDPATALVRGQLNLDSAGYVQIAPWSTATNIPGVFAAGDVADPKLPPSRHRGRHGVHGRFGGGEIPSRTLPRRDALRAREARTEQMIGAWD